MHKIIGLLIALAVLATACGGDDDDVATEEPSDQSGAQTDPPRSGSTGDTPEPADETEPDEDEGNAPDGGSSSVLCSLGAEYEGVDPFEGVGILDGEEFFERAEELWNDVASAVPGELSDEVTTIRGGLDEMRGVLEKYDYDFFSEELQQELELIDTGPMDAASVAFDDYMLSECGIDFNVGTPDNGRSQAAPPALDPEELQENLENLDTNDTAAILQQVFGIDAELAQCLNDELGGLDPNNIDSAMLTEAVCGTTLLEVISGVGG